MKPRALLACLLASTLAFAYEAGAASKAKPHWGAIAYSSATGAYGYAVDFPTARAAENEAFRKCGSDCDVIRSFRETCGAIAARDRRFAWDTGLERHLAEARALRKCGGEDCKIIVWGCTTRK